MEIDDSVLLLERLGSFRKGYFREMAVNMDIPLIHVEIIAYLAICNKYSDSLSALVEYLGQTKGSVSQSVKKMKENKIIVGTVGQEDRRTIHLKLTEKGNELWGRIKEAQPQGCLMNEETFNQLKTFLINLQKENGMKGFSICKTCRYNKRKSESKFFCGLTKELLTVEDTLKICREHDYT